ncbi:MAG: Maf family protein [Phycisphaerales bacterium]|nr:Maf family protein [Phycisphaerales bacterium]
MPHDADNLPLILASASPQRGRLLSEAGFPHDVRPCPLAEPTNRPSACGPAAWAMALAYFKARYVAEQLADRWVLGADTIVAIPADRANVDADILGKPRDLDDARRMLKAQARVECAVITGICLTRVGETAERLVLSVATRVRMRDDEGAREAYLASGDWLGKAGAYGIQTVGDALVESITGSFSNVVGLPMEVVAGLLRARETP